MVVSYVTFVSSPHLSFFWDSDSDIVLAFSLVFFKSTKHDQ